MSNLTQRTKTKEKTVTDTATNMASTYEKCPEMSQLMLRKAEPRLGCEPENGSFPEIDDFLNFQEKKNEAFSGVPDTKTTKKRVLGPEYRVIDKYVKNTRQY